MLIKKRKRENIDVRIILQGFVYRPYRMSNIDIVTGMGFTTITFLTLVIFLWQIRASCSENNVPQHGACRERAVLEEEKKRDGCYQFGHKQIIPMSRTW